MGDLTVSIIIPVYNGAKTMPACLESLLKQDYPADAFEIIVVENGSTDNTAAVIRQYPVRLLHSHQRGPAAARNMGIAHSQKEIIAFTDADCIADPGWLRNLTAPYADPCVGGVAGEIVAYRHGNRNMIEMFSDEHSPLRNFISGAAEFLPHLYTANASYRRAALQQVGGFNPTLFTGEDVDLSWRVQLYTPYRVSYAPEAVIYHNHRSSKRGLARQYRQYGFGEILLDTIYGRQKNYPRTRSFQARRILSQLLALPRYVIPIVLRWYRYKRGRLSQVQASMPQLMLMIEYHNILGKLEALILTRLMTSTRNLVETKLDNYITRYY